MSTTMHYDGPDGENNLDDPHPERTEEVVLGFIRAFDKECRTGTRLNQYAGARRIKSRYVSAAVEKLVEAGQIHIERRPWGKGGRMIKIYMPGKGNDPST